MLESVVPRRRVGLRLVRTAALRAALPLLFRSERSNVLNPLAYRTIRPIEGWLRERPRLWALLNRESAIPSDMKAPRTSRTDDPARRAVVIGHGPTGRTVVRLLRDNGISPTVIELNMDAVRALREEGTDAIYGDATRPETLEAAGIGKAGSLILGSAGMANSADVIRTARAINPHVKVLARASYLRDVPSLKAGGREQCLLG
jgi:CPA2 family monovalent cation:H+ antiporter-2